MRRFLAYVVMMLTMLSAVIFNTQAVLENKVDAMEYGTGTQLVYSLTKRDAKNYSDKYLDYKENPDSLQELSDIDIESAVMARLDAAGVRNSDVSIVKGNKNAFSGEEIGYELRINLSPLSDTELANVKEILSFTGSLSIGTEGDTQVYYEASNEFFDTDGDVAELTYSGTTPYPVIKVKDNTSYDDLKKAADEAKSNNASEAHRFYADDDDSTEETATKVYLWMNKTIDDTYDKAFGTHDTVVMQETKAKVLAEIDISNWDSDNLALSLTTDTKGNEFTISSARAFVNMLNCDDYGFDIQFLYQNALSATFGTSALGLTYLIFGIVLLVICIAMIAFYGIAGVTASLNMLASVICSFFLFSVLGFEFSVAALSAIAIIVGLSVMISINYFERVKHELKNGRGILKANQEGYHKSFLTSLDVSAVSLIASVFCFLIGTGAFKTFFGVVMVGTIFTFLITNYINKWMMYWLVRGNESSNLPFFGFKKNLKEKLDAKVEKAASGKVFGKKMLILPIASCLAIAVGFPVGYTLSSSSSRSFFNNYNDFASTYTLNVTFRDNGQAYDRLSTTDNYTNYIVAMGDQGLGGKYVAIDSNDYDGHKLADSEFVYDAKSAYVNVVEKTDEENNKYFMVYYSLKISKDLKDVQADQGNQKVVLDVIRDTMKESNVIIGKGNGGINISPFAGDSHGVKDSLLVDTYEVTATNVTHISNYLILLSFLVGCFAFVYLLVRFGLNISLASLATSSLSTALYLGILALCRIPYSSYTVFGILIAILLLNMFFVPVLGRNREVLKERGLKKKATDEQRMEIASKSGILALKLVLPVSLILLVYSIGLAFVNVALIGLTIVSVISIVLNFFALYLFAIPFYHFLCCHISFAKMEAAHQKHLEKKAEKKHLKKEEVKRVAGPDGILYVDDGPHETVIPGLNDFRNND